MSTDSRFMEIEQRLDSGSARMTRIEAKLDENSADTGEVLDILRSARGFFKVLGVIGTIVKWLVTIGAGITGMWLAWKTGKS